MPLGKLKAYTIVGVVWGLWHAPLVAVGFNYPGYPVTGMIAMVALTTAIGVYINELTLRNRSSILAGWVHGVFNGQAYGIWRLICRVCLISICRGGANLRDSFAGEPIHSVWAYNYATQWAVLVTVYRPDPERWIDWRIRRKR